ncbi:hypothetical protein [Salinicola tamaricis]|uniref:hypothetical protein n=1 Tax=Salinicola tamaricis TaxID=1771309 RepID=UPI003BF51F9A
MSHPPPLKAGERAFNLLLLLFSAGVFYEAYRISGFDLPNSAGAFPLLLGAIMIVTMLSILLGQRHHPRPAAGGALGELRQFLATHFPLPVVLFSLLAVGYLLAPAGTRLHRCHGTVPAHRPALSAARPLAQRRARHRADHRGDLCAVHTAVPGLSPLNRQRLANEVFHG